MARRRLLYLIPASVSALTAVLGVVALQRGLEGTEQVFPGFFYHVNGTVAALQRGGWEGPRQGIRAGDLVVALDGRKVNDGEDLRARLERRRPGEVVDFLIRQRKDGGLRTFRVRLRRLTTSDVLATFVLPFGIGVMYLLLGAVIFFVKRTYEAALAMSVCVVASVYHLTTFDAHTTQTLVRVWVAYPLLGAVAVHLFAVFPAVRPGFHRPAVLAIAYGFAAATLTVIELNLTDPAIATVYAVIHAAYLTACFLACLVLLTITARNEPSEVIRNKAKTIRLGLLLTAAAGVLWSLLVRVYPELITAERAMMLSALFPVVLTYAVIRRNLFDIEFVLRTTAVYTVATVLVVALYFGVVFVIGMAMGTWTQRFTGVTSSLPVAIVSTLVVALAFHPVRVGVQRVVDRFFFREKGMLEEALVRLTRDLPGESPDLSELGRRLTGQAVEVLRCGFAALLCPDPASNEFQVTAVAGEAGEAVRTLVVARDSAAMTELVKRDEPFDSWPGPDAATEDLPALLRRGKIGLVIPLRTAHSLAGVMLLGPRPHGDVFTRFDLHLLRRLAPPTSLVLQNALLLREHAEKERLAALGKLAAVIIHEIKNPLGIIRVSSGTLKKRFPRDDSGHELASFIEEEVVRMNHTIAQFLTFARPQNPTLAPFDMAELVHRTTQAAQQELEDNGVRLEVDLERPVEVLADAAQVQQVLLNLLVNAKQALEGKEGGRVAVEVRRRGERGEVVVADNGPGIDRTSRERVFEPFYTTRRGGTGLGLAIARQLLAEQGGRIRLEAADEGARFVVGLPLA